MKQRVTTILKLSTPIIIAMLSQSLLNLVDAALVGPLGKEALAAVGAASYANFVALSLVAGLSAGVQAQVARRLGAGHSLHCATPVNHGIIIALFFALPVSLILMVLAPWILQIFNQGELVHDTAVSYFRIRVMSLTAAALCLSFRGYWNGTGRPSGFLRILVISHLFNALVSFCLIYGIGPLPAMGVAGAALGTFLAMYLAAMLNMFSLMGIAREQGFMDFRFLIKRDFRQTIRLIRLAVPDSLQQLLFSFGFMVLFAIIARMGTGELAVAHVLMNISLLLILPGMGMGMAANTLVSQSLGAGKPDKAWRWGWDIVKVAASVLLFLSLPLLIAPELMLSLFLHQESLVEMGKIPLQLTGMSIFLDAASLVFTQALLGAGANRTVLGIRAAGQWLILLPLCWLVGPVLGLGLTAVWLVQTLQRLISSMAFVMVWQTRKWERVTV
ncbi:MULTISPECIES: MATE family efflux transporter [unclassified Endozoicomonas]|uniref:MATE family efflux transporter n=1 Tax=unclassified Endozoicomonas TaxID=2644528 RepID=UPI003BB5DCCA